jgi:predicted nucleotidyltransferase
VSSSIPALSLSPSNQDAASRLAATHGVTLLHGVLSGPLAWGLPFEDKTGTDPLVQAGIFAHPVSAYLGLAEPPDILRLDGEGDRPPILAWDLRKALRLMTRSNATVWEWLVGGSVFLDGGAPFDALRELARAHYSRRILLGHYLGLAKVAMNAYFQDAPRDAARIKYMHTARALMAVDWILTKNAPPPVDWATLRAGTDLPDAAAATLDALALEPLEDRRHAGVDAWIDGVFQTARERGDDLADGHPAAADIEPILRDLLGPAAQRP